MSCFSETINQLNCLQCCVSPQIRLEVPGCNSMQAHLVFITKENNTKKRNKFLFQHVCLLTADLEELLDLKTRHMSRCQSEVRLMFPSWQKMSVLSVRSGHFLTLSSKSQTKLGIWKARQVFLCNVFRETALSHSPLTPLPWEERGRNRSLALKQIKPKSD